jgi:L-threonylcarbamoyladenylate synthase
MPGEMKTLFLDHSATSIKMAAELLKNGEVVALPTETVYGLAGNAFATGSVAKIFAAKERPSYDPLIVHLSDQLLLPPPGSSILETLVAQKIIHPEVLHWPSRALLENAMKKYWPGPLTFILPRGSRIPDAVTSGQNTVGIRMPAHPVFQGVLKECGLPLAAPSANRFGRISPTAASHVSQELDGRIAAIVDGGACTVGVESTIVRVENPLQVTLLRPGKIGAQDLAAHFGVPVGSQATLGEKNNIAQLAPGMLEEHYAPQKPLFLFPHSFTEKEKMQNFLVQNHISGKIGYLAMSKAPALPAEVLSAEGDIFTMAQNLFAALRRLDANPAITLIVADLPPQIQNGIGFAIADRLVRASRNKPSLHS